jgi:hypothetical protein
MKPEHIEIAEQIARDASCAQGEFGQRVLSIIPYLTEVCDRAALPPLRAREEIARDYEIYLSNYRRAVTRSSPKLSLPTPSPAPPGRNGGLSIQRSFRTAN